MFFLKEFCNQMPCLLLQLIKRAFLDAMHETTPREPPSISAIHLVYSRISGRIENFNHLVKLWPEVVDKVVEFVANNPDHVINSGREMVSLLICWKKLWFLWHNMFLQLYLVLTT